MKGVHFGKLIFGLMLLHSNFTSAQFRGDSFSIAENTKMANLVYVYDDVEGFVSNDGEGNLSGLLVEMMSAFESYVFTKFGITIDGTYKSLDNDDFQGYLDLVKNSSGGVFGLHTTTIIEERKAYLKFSPAILNNISVLITSKYVPRLSSMDNINTEFKSFVCYTAPGSTYYKRALDLKRNGFTDLKIDLIPSIYGFMDSILADRNSFGFIDLSWYLEYLRKNEPIRRHPVGDKLGEKYGIIMPLSCDWDIILAEFLNGGFLKSVQYRQMVIRNLGKGALRMLQ